MRSSLSLQEAHFDSIPDSSALESQAPASLPPSLRLHENLAPEAFVPESFVAEEAERFDGDRHVLPATMARLKIARTRIHDAARSGQRIRTYEVALDLDMSEFHFARQFRLAFDRSPHVYYDEVRADSARAMLSSGMSEGIVARRIGFRRPAELRALLAKRAAGTLPPDHDC